MRAIAVALLVALACNVSACAGYDQRGTLPPLAIELREGPTRHSFMHLLRVARALSYLIEFSDPDFGVFGARSQVPTPRGQADLVFVVQCYGDGHATLSVVGAPLVGAGRVRVPDRVRREAVALAQALEGRGTR